MEKVKEKVAAPRFPSISACTFVLVSVCILFLFSLNLFCGSVPLSATDVWAVLAGRETDSTTSFIVLQSRLPQAVTALLAGASLAVSGLMLQTVFANPLADPAILGINSGAGLGVGLVMLLFGGSVVGASFSLSGFVLIVMAAFAGSACVILLLLFFSSIVRSNLVLLILGIMISYAVSSLISLLNYAASADSLQAFVMWGMGSFNGVSIERLPLFSTVLLLALGGSVLLVKSLNALLLGENYAVNLGIKMRRIRTLLLVDVGVLSAVVTAFCGPIAFIGLAVPHIARLLLGRADHRNLLPLTLLLGSALALLCLFLCSLPHDRGLIPLNVVTPLFGVPVILYVILRKNKIE